MKGFSYGLKKGIPLGLGYLAVAFAFGVKCRTSNFTPLWATFFSLTNLTSAGQYAGLEMILEGASYVEMALAVFLINLRYALMSISLSQKLADDIPVWKRLIFGFGISDETFAVAATEDKKITAEYMFGLILFPIIGWALGTFLGALLGGIFSSRILCAFDIALYAMFIAIILPDCKKSVAVTLVCLVSIALSCMFTYIPYIKEIGLGFKIIIIAVIASALGALLFPIKEGVEENEL